MPKWPKNIKLSIKKAGRPALFIVKVGDFKSPHPGEKGRIIRSGNIVPQVPSVVLRCFRVLRGGVCH